MKNETTCAGCQSTLKIKVLKSPGGGWYLGYFCSNCGPYRRESSYFETEADAKGALNFYYQESL